MPIFIKNQTLVNLFAVKGVQDAWAKWDFTPKRQPL
jgi:hypothetical protein